MDLYLKSKIIEKYNKEKGEDTKRFYLENDTIVEEKKNGYKKFYHYDYLETSYRGFLNDEELNDAIDYIKCILGIDEDDDKALSSHVELWSKGTSLYHHEWIDLEVGQIYNETEQFAEILQGLRNENMFITPNTFTTKGHKMNSLMSINAITIDLDYKKMPKYEYCTPEEVISILENEYFWGTIDEMADKNLKMPADRVPKPNFIEYSNQIRLIYLVDKIKLPKKGRRKLIRFVKAIKRKIEKRLKGFGADSSPNLNSFIRVPYSINKKKVYELCCIEKKGEEKYFKNPIAENRYKVDIKEYSRQRYNIQDIADKFIDREEVEKYLKKYKEKKKKKRKLIQFKEKNGEFLISKYNLDRLDDIEKLQDLKNKEIVSIHREELCFAYMVHLKLYGYDYKEIISKMECFIYKFNDNSKARILISKCKNVLQKNYRFTSKGIREFFGISESFCIEYGLTSFLRIEYTEEYKRKYAREYYNTFLRESRKFHHLEQDKKESIFIMNNEGMSVAQIAKKLGCKVQTVYNYLKGEVKAIKKNIAKSIEEAIKLIQEGLSIKKAAEKLNVKYDTLRKRIYRYTKQKAI